MNLKYYLRGLGIGIVVTALLMSLATRDRNHMTDEEIKERAAALGMVEQKVLADVSTPVPEEIVAKPTFVPEITEKPVVTEEPEVTEGPDKTKEPENEDIEPTATPTEVPTIAPNEEVAESITFVIKSGETSWSISKALYEAGVVENAADFDTYLCQNGYDKTIRTGTYEISKNASYEDIAKKIAR